MFDRVTLRRSEGHLPISFGQIAEALLYYQKVHIFFDRGTLFSLIEQIGTKNLLELVHRPEVSGVYCEELLGTASDSAGISPYYRFVITVFAGGDKDKKLKPLQARLEYELKLKGHSEPEAMRFSRLFLAKVPKRDLSNNHFIPGGILDATTSDLLDHLYIEKIIRSIISITPGGYLAGEDLSFKVMNTSQGMYVDTNINLDFINQKRSQLYPPVEPLTIASLLTHIFDSRADLALAAYYGSDFTTSTINSSIIQIRHTEMLRRSNINTDIRKQFSEIILPNSPSLAEVIDSKERSFNEFLKLLDNAKKYKTWLKNVNPDENLIRDYMNRISSEGWIDTLPVKGLRYVIPLGVGLYNPLLGAAAGFANEFILNKILKGWRPNHFVSDKLSPFVNGN